MGLQSQVCSIVSINCSIIDTITYLSGLVASLIDILHSRSIVVLSRRRLWSDMIQPLTALTCILLITAVDSYSPSSSSSLLRSLHAKPISIISSSFYREKLRKRVSSSISAVNVPVAISLPQVSGQNWWIWSLLASTSSLGIVLENTKIGAMLSSPLVTMGISLILCNLGVLPSSSPVYSTVLKVRRTRTTYVIDLHFFVTHLEYLFVDVRAACSTSASSRC